MQNGARVPLKTLQEPGMAELRLALPCCAFLALAARTDLRRGIVRSILFSRFTWNDLGVSCGYWGLTQKCSVVFFLFFSLSIVSCRLCEFNIM